jgi:aminoglycoside phosphotransferase (APT) family kinase protein
MSRLAAAAEQAGTRVIRVLPPRSAGNELAEVEQEGRRLLLKAWPPQSSGARREMAAAAAFQHTALAAPRLRGHGTSALGEWVLLDWFDLHEIPQTAAAGEQAGRLLAQVHRTPLPSAGADLRRYGDVGGLIAEKAWLVARFDRSLADRITRMASQVASAARQPAAEVLLHGDYGWRNLATDPAGRLITFDFEHAAIGPPAYDLAKLWDRELADDRARTRFLDGYRQVSTALDHGLDATMRPIRLWAAAGIFPHARATADDDFYQHGLVILGRLDRELAGSAGPGWRR